MRAGASIIAFLMLAAAMPPGAAQAQLSQDWKQCVNKGNEFPLDREIGGCTAIIQSGSASPKDLSAAYSNRGNAYLSKKDNDRAIEDYTEAIRLDPSLKAAYSNRDQARRLAEKSHGPYLNSRVRKQILMDN